MEIVYVVSDSQIIQSSAAITGQIEIESSISVPPPFIFEISTRFMLVRIILKETFVP
jgi:hypothetical protein